MSEGVLSVAAITTLVALIFTLFFQYFPGLRLKWAALAGEAKKGIVLGIYLVVGAIVGFGGCFAPLNEVIKGLACVSPALFLEFVLGVLIAIGAGQGLFSILPELADVAAVKDARPE